MLCAGKVFYDLAAERERLGRDDVAILRVEQLYPLASDLMRSLVERHGGATSLMWVQEEPRNMGAWTFIEPTLRELFRGRFGEPIYVGRQASASPATGHSESHNLERKLILEAAFADL